MTKKTVDNVTYYTSSELDIGTCEGCVAQDDRRLCYYLAEDEYGNYQCHKTIWVTTETANQTDINVNEALLILQEECAEVTQAVSKVLRFGWNSSHPERNKTNQEELEEELGDLLAMYDILVSSGTLDAENVFEARGNKHAKLLQYSKVFSNE